MSLTPGWPHDVAYLDAIQTPWVCFTDQQLKAAQIYVDRRGIPLAATGRSAIVFRADVSSADVALRCFTREAQGQRLRYQALHEHLADSIPSYMVDFKYRDHEIRVAGELYPVVEMDWAEGQPLHLWVEQHLQYPHDLVRLAALWLRAVKDLQARSMAHGDLSSDNCLVTWNKLTLIDYDSFFIPQLAGSNPGEAGNPHFQHPDRMGYYALNMDAFPALVIYLSLLALAADKSLWEFHNGKNLIFTAEDYVSPRKTPLWRALARSPDKRIVPLLIALEDMCGSPIDVLPPLSQVAAESSVTWGRAWWPVRAGGPRWLSQHLLRLRPGGGILRRVRPRWAAWLVAGAAGLVFLGVWLTAGGSPTTSDINSVAFSPDSKTMAGVDADGGVYLWDIPARHRVATLPDPGKQAVVSVAFSPDGKTLAVVDADGSIYLWGLPARNLVVTLSASTDQAVKSAAFSPDGKTLATADADGVTYLWDIPARSQVATLPDPGKQAVVSVAFSPDGKTLATADAAGVTYLWDVPARSLVATVPDPGKQAVASVAFSPDGKTLATADAAGVTYLWDIPARSQVAALPDPGKQAVRSAAFSPDGRTLATADAAGVTYLWDVSARSLVATLPDPGKQAVVSVAFSPDGKTLATADAAGGTYLWGIPAKP